MDLKVGDLVKNDFAYSPPQRIARIVRLTKYTITLKDLPMGLTTDGYQYTLEKDMTVDKGKIRLCTKLELLLLGLDHEL